MAETTHAVGTRAEVGLYGFVRDIGVPKHLSLEVPRGPCLREVLERLACVAGDRARQRLFTAAGDLGPGVCVFVGGQAISSLDERLPDAPSVPIKIVVLNAVAGG